MAQALTEYTTSPRRSQVTFVRQYMKFFITIIVFRDKNSKKLVIGYFPQIIGYDKSDNWVIVVGSKQLSKFPARQYIINLSFRRLE